MDFWLRIAYPFLVVLWLLSSLALNAWTQRRQRHYSTKLNCDDFIPFVPGFAFLYFSAYILGNTGYLLLQADQNFSRIFIGYLILFGLGIASYILLPCRVERREELVVTNVSTYLLSAFQRRSKPFNSFPSMHVSYCLFSALAVIYFGSMVLGLVLLIWVVLVAISTLLTKQHHLLDVIAGAVLAVFTFWLI
jgi:membrane-associated phospholipid phosphatase